MVVKPKTVNTIQQKTGLYRRTSNLQFFFHLTLVKKIVQQKHYLASLSEKHEPQIISKRK